MIRAGSTITMEAWDNKYKPNQDWNHAWGAVPANVIPRKLMGIEPLTPGWDTFSIRPQIGSLEMASIDVPTIKGTISVSCQQDASSYTMAFTVPVNTSEEVALPLPQRGQPEVKLNGQPIKVKVKEGWLKLQPMASGTHQLTVKFDPPSF